MKRLITILYAILLTFAVQAQMLAPIGFFNSESAVESAKSLQLDGVNQSLSIGSDIFNSLTDYTVSFWIYRENSATAEALLAVGKDANSYYSISIMTDGRLQVLTRRYGTYDNIIRSTATLSDEQWYFITVGKSGSTHQFTIDGVLDTLDYAISTDLNTGMGSIASTNYSYLGVLVRPGSSNIQQFEGKIFLPTIWDSYLTVGEVNTAKALDDYDSISSDIESQWRFEDENISGTTVYDVYGLNDGTIINGANTSTDIPNFD